MAATRGFGIDVGGSGIKGALVDLDTGEFIGDRLRIDTPQPATPGAVADVVGEIVRHFDWDGPVGVTLPAVVKQGVAHTAANIDPSWIGTDADALFAKRLGRSRDDVAMLNDADAAGLAEMRFGDPAVRSGVVALLTFGTGIGSALFDDGKLMPNTEFGHIEVDGHDGETRAAASVKDREELSYPEWAARVDRYLTVLENLIWPDRFIVGGGVSKKAEKWVPLLTNRTPVVAASLQNNAGIAGAAAAAAEGIEP
ncbi:MULTISPECIES: polyphosphate--glucose phosphotransferase [Prauserella salsuginis group]|uniref:Polyphosphate glucokinase n=2 Tax=Prauserella salsuginis group TaxID=2893672 RepID=A0A839XU86_9PSEU|nr:MULTISPECIES: ROK family protein [Prauserella salsuginis group]MBB3664954.1 polyphosphate glucokinase [Prauserella sediminis]MCR3718425.1 polyphosphate glucokinase [Prauserella flava]MCR3732995.1 polyphosphate glucokinase [Prauserella salsuginis]